MTSNVINQSLINSTILEAIAITIPSCVLKMQIF